MADFYLTTLPASINEKELESELQSSFPGCKVRLEPNTKFERWPYSEKNKPNYLDEPEDLNDPYEKPRILFVTGCASGTKEQAVQAVVNAHAPSRDTETEAIEARNEQLTQMIESLSTAQQLRIKLALGLK